MNQGGLVWKLKATRLLQILIELLMSAHSWTRAALLYKCSVFISSSESLHKKSMYLCKCRTLVH